jgi:hypothetical protein
LPVAEKLTLILNVTFAAGRIQYTLSPSKEHSLFQLAEFCSTEGATPQGKSGMQSASKNREHL